MAIGMAIGQFLKCEVVAIRGNRVLVHTKLDGHTLLMLERHIRRATGNHEIEILCEAVADKNVLRRLKEMRGVKAE